MVLPWKREKQKEVSSWDSAWLLEDFHRSSPLPFFSCTQFWFALKGLVWKHWNCCPVLCCHACGIQMKSLLCHECWKNIQPWQLGIDGEAEPSRCQWGMMRLGLLSVTSLLENVWLVSFSSSTITTCMNIKLCVTAIQHSWLPLRKSSVPS